MKTIIENSTKLSKYIFADDVELTPEYDKTTTPYFIIGDLNINNSIIIENVTPPNDWVGNKYIYDNGTFTLNPNWTEAE